MRLLTAIALSCLTGHAAELHAGTGQAHPTAAGAIRSARPGDTVVLHPGTYHESRLLIDKPLTLTGGGHAVIDGGSSGDVLTVTASDVILRGLELQNTGTSSLEDRAGIRIAGANRVTATGNRIRNCHFGISLAKAADCSVAGNHIEGTPVSEQDSGNGIHLWSCSRITAEHNSVTGQRDGIYLEFTTDSVVRGNRILGNLRYGLHFMFSHGNSYHGNLFAGNGAGVAVMYSRHVEMTGNRFFHNWGPSSYGLLLKEMTDGRIEGNRFEKNTTGISLHGSSRMTITGNQFTGNGWAVQMQSSSTDNRFTGNNFTANAFDFAADGNPGGNLLDCNYWDKYEGYDLNRDGTGDIPCRPVSLYAVIVHRAPPSVLLLRSPVVHFLDQAEKAFPSITPESIADLHPAMRPHHLGLSAVPDR